MNNTLNVQKPFDPNDSKEFKSFFAGCIDIHEKYMAKCFPDWEKKGLKKVKFSFKNNRKYVKIIRDNSVHCFLDKTNGDVLKAAGWNVPAKHVRGNIFDSTNGLEHMGEYGLVHLR